MNQEVLAEHKTYALPLTPEQFLEKARKVTGINLPDDEALEALTALVGSYNQDSCFHKEGVVVMEQTLLRLLCNRLRMKRDFIAHPEIADETVEAPVFIYGLARSGTTKTQKFLAASGDFNGLKFWHTFSPALLTGDRNEPLEPRIQAADDFTHWLAKTSPESLQGHPAETHEPEEETLLMDQGLLNPGFARYAEMPSYLAWMSEQNMTFYFEYLKDMLKYLQWQGLASSSKPWLLKSPMYFGMEPLIRKVFPDATLIMTHRHPYETLASACKLFKVWHPAFGNPDTDYRAMVEGTAVMMDIHMQLRELGEIDALDICSVTSKESPEQIAERIFSHADMEFSDAARERVKAWEKGHPKNRFGKFKYSLEEFGLSEQFVDALFPKYIDLVKRLS